jgi:hypothetical protein
MEILNINTVSNTLTETIDTKCGQKFILVQTFTNGGSELNYSVYDFKGVEVTDEPEIDEMMGRYFSIKDELINGITSEDDDALDIDPFK